jgi:hypothetical protein
MNPNNLGDVLFAVVVLPFAGFVVGYLYGTAREQRRRRDEDR